MRTKNFKHDKVSGPVKSFFEGTAGVFFVFALICLFGGGAEGAGPALVMGAISLISFGISYLIPPKDQYTQR
jgi:hypothetical protein